jgi:hypothetical protein
VYLTGIYIGFSQGQGPCWRSRVPLATHQELRLLRRHELGGCRKLRCIAQSVKQRRCVGRDERHIVRRLDTQSTLTGSICQSSRKFLTADPVRDPDLNHFSTHSTYRSLNYSGFFSASGQGTTPRTVAPTASPQANSKLASRPSMSHVKVKTFPSVVLDSSFMLPCQK